MKNKFGFILVKPQLGENIGASARALKNFGFSNLSIVKPRDSWPNIKAKATSVGAYEILKKTKRIPVANSTKGYPIEIDALHLIHFPLCINQLIKGMFSFQVNLFLHFGQKLLGFIIDKSFWKR